MKEVTAPSVLRHAHVPEPPPIAPEPSSFILRLPKAELHLHLEGTIEPATLVELSRKYDTQPLDEAAVEHLYRYEDFARFITAFKTVTERLRAPADYELVTYRLMERLHAENVLHAEVYFAAGVCYWRGQDVDAIFEGMERGRARGQRDFGVSLLWIFDAVRQFGPDAAERVFTKAAQLRDRGVVGVGIGGDERRAGPEIFHDVYQHAKAAGLRLTAHAGESCGPGSVWGALNLGAERLGHALTAWQDRELLAVLVERQIPVEACLSSNLHTGCCHTIRQHPLKTYFDVGVMLTLNSDDPAMFRTSLAREYALAQQQFEFTDEHLRELARNSFEASFLPAEKKIEFLNQVDSA